MNAVPIKGVLAVLLCASPEAVTVEGMTLTTSGALPKDAKCVLKVDAVTLSRAEPCTVTALNEKYTLPNGEAQFVAKSEPAYAGRLMLKAEAMVKAHQHEGSIEVVVIVSGRGTFVLDGKSREVQPGDAMVIPKGVTHAFFAGPAPVQAVQFYLPPGPEERFRPKEKK